MDKYRILVKGIIKCGEKYLVVKKWYDDRVSEPYQWEFIDGVIEFGEKPDNAVTRLVLEQTGLTTTNDRILYTWSFLTGDIFNIGISYLCLASIDEVVLSEDLSGFRWITREEMEAYISKKVLADIERVEL